MNVRENDLVAFSNLMHELDAARGRIRKTTSELNRLSISGNIDIATARAHANSLVEQLDLLDILFEYLRIELNPLLIEQAPKLEQNLHMIFHRALKHYHSQLAAKKIKPVLEPIEGFIVNASLSLSVVPLILIDNAIKYSPNGASIEVSFSSQNRTVTLDSQGPQIEDDEVGSIFERGRRGRHAGLTSTRGQGLGLYIAKTICNANGFELGVSQGRSTYNVAGIPYTTVSFRIKFN